MIGARSQSKAILPVGWIATTTHNRCNYNAIGIDSLQNGIRKFESQTTPNLTFNDRSALGRANDSKYGILDRVDERLVSVLLGEKFHSLGIFLQSNWVKFIFH